MTAAEPGAPEAASEPAPGADDAPAAAPESEPAPTRERPRLGERPGPIEPGDAFARAGRKAMWPHVERLLAREAALRDPGATDSLKRYRVATRRLRAAIRVFRDAYPSRATKGLRSGLSELADAVGAVRDLDVLIAHVGAWAASQEPDARDGVAPLHDAWTEQRAAGAAALTHRIETRRHARLIDALVLFVSSVDEAGPEDTDAPPRPIGDRSASAIWTAYELVRAYATVVRWADDDTLHQLRIEAKRLRYTIEFLGGLLGQEQAWLVERLVELQDHLGALNDAVVAAAATRAFLGERHAALSPVERRAVETYLAEREREAGRLRRGVLRRWRPVVSVTFSRRLASAVAPRRSKASPPA